MTALKTLLFVLALTYTLAHDDITCGFNSYDHTPEFLDVEEDMRALQQDGEGRLLKGGYSTMRIHADYSALQSSATSSYVNYIKNDIVPPVLSYFAGALRVKYPVVGKLKLASNVGNVCGQKVPSALRSGVNADYVILFGSNSKSTTVVATSKYCYLATGTKRPLISQTVFNRQQFLNSKDVLEIEKNMYLLIHEMMHTFGISDNNYKYYLDSNGRTRKGHIRSLSIAGKRRTVIDIPELTSRLRKFYGCSSIPGIIMENDGGSGTADSHPERKFFVYETMSSGGVYGRRVSEFSLALLEGSGWYVPDYKYAEPYFFGQGQGCGFVNNKCSASSSSFSEFCGGSDRGCAPHGRGGGKCRSDSKSDGCKYYNPDVDYDCENPDGEDNARLPELQVYGRGAGSRCFTGDLNTRKSSNGKTSFCFKYSCSGSGSGTSVTVQVGRNNVVCTKKGKKAINGYYGSVDCPDPLEFCATVGKKYCPRNCMGRGSCVNNKCVCRPGFKGVDCGLRG